MKSMTGYACEVESVDGYEIKVEIKSLNSKFLSVNISLPQYLNFCEVEINEMISERIKRGKVSIKVFVNFIETPASVKVNLGLAKAYYDALEEIATTVGIPEPVKLDNLLRFKEVVYFEPAPEQAEQICTLVKKVLLKALEKLDEERQREGEKLKRKLEEFVNGMEEKLEVIKNNSSKMIEYYMDKLRKNVEKLLPSDAVLDLNTLETAVAVLAERADIKEEMDRIESHIARVKELLNSEKPVGHNLDFLAQELLREFNTILSKSKTIEITNAALEGKILVNSFREQIQNIE